MFTEGLIKKNKIFNLNNNISLDKSKNNYSTINFSQLLKKAITKINDIQNNATETIKKFENHQKNVSLNDVMIELQKSSIAIHMAVEIKNKIISSYKEIMNLQL